MNNIEELIEFLREKGERLVPISKKECLRIETTYNITLPLTYKKFLLSMGKEAGRFMRGSSAFFSEIFELKEWAEELLEENNFKPLPENVFVFWCHQGYQIAFFKLDEGDNPPVYFYGEGLKLTDFDTGYSLLEFFEKETSIWS